MAPTDYSCIMFCYGGKNMWLDSLVWIVLYTLVYFGVNFALAMFLDKRVGNFWIWFLIVSILPVIGHIFAITYVTVFLPKKNSELRKVYKDRSLGELVDNLQKKPDTKRSVTPFDEEMKQSSDLLHRPDGGEDRPKIGLDGKPIE
jgi:hypothetical protein